MANSNRRNNFIDSLLINDTIYTNRAEINEHIVYFYQKLYTKQFSWRPLVDDLSFDYIEKRLRLVGWREFLRKRR
jgi:hypothetical protein